MLIEKVNEKLRKHLGKLKGDKDFWGVLHLGKMLEAGKDIEQWRDTWARELLIYFRSPVIESHIDDGDDPEARQRQSDFAEF